MATEHGNLSINSQNIFPIIKKWLYSDHDIFYRELISNGCDAITKLKKLALIGEYAQPEETEYKLTVRVNDEARTICIEDNGIGMTAQEVNEYINQIAFSGAEAFLEKYKDKASDDQIIGHFGLGFYSAFMVADKVAIDTLSYAEGAKGVHWECDGGTEYDMSDSSRTAPGTTITLYLNEESHEFANLYRAREVIEKYCSFMPVPIYLEKENAQEETQVIDASEVTPRDTVLETFTEPAKTEEQKDDDGNVKMVETEPARERAKIVKRPVPVNDTHPLWAKHPNECGEEDYKAFYTKVFREYREPLFWIHLNMDYPFNLKGILYFPKLNTRYDTLEGTIKLYNNQVFIADNIKEVIPEFLLLLKGVIDCPDLPLNVSRSALQNDGFVKKISDYITKKVADKLTGMFKTDRDNYNKYWDDIHPFIKFGCLKDDKFYDKMKEAMIFKNLAGDYLTLAQCLEENKEHHENTVFYVTDETEQSQYVNMFKDAGLDAVVLSHHIDQPFITHLEGKNENLKFSRIDADLADTFKEEADQEELKSMTETLGGLFKKALALENLAVQAEKLKNPEISAIITLSEESRRMQDMMKMYNMYGMNPDMFGNEGQTLVLNSSNELVQYILKNNEGAHTELLCRHIYDLAKLSHAPLKPEEMTGFIARSNEIMKLLAKS